MNQLRNISDFSDEELSDMVDNHPDDAKIVNELFTKSIEEIKYQLDLIDRYFSGFSQRSGTIMTLASLVSFLPAIAGLNILYLKQFLIWTFPFLLLALILHYFSSIRPSALATQVPSFPKGTKGELLTMKASYKTYQVIWTKYKDLFDSVQNRFRWVSAFVYMYLISFSINFYLFVFGFELSCYKKVMVLAVSVSIGLLAIYRTKLKSVKNLSFGPNIPINSSN